MNRIWGAGVGIIFISGCMNYQPLPETAVGHNSYAEVQQQEKALLPAELAVLTLPEAQRLALKNNRDFKSIATAVDAARARYYQSYSAYAPTVNVGMSISQSFNKMYSATNAVKNRSQSESYSPTVSGQLLVFDCLAREMNVLSQKYALNQSRAELEDARRLLLRAVAYAYNDVLLAMAQRDITLAEIEYNRDMLAEAQRKYKAETVLLSDVLNFQITLRSSELNLIQNNYQIMANKYILAGYLGLVAGTIPDTMKFSKIELIEITNLSDITLYLDQAIANRPDLQAYLHALQASKYSYWSEIASAFGPSITANYELGYAQSRSIQHGGGVSSHGGSGTGNLNYGVQASWNLFNGFSDYYQAQANLANIAGIEYTTAQAWITVVTDVRTAYENYLSNVQKVKLSKEICDLTLKTRDLVRNEYKAGRALVTRLNEAERDLTEAQNNLVTVVLNVANAKAQLEAAVYAAGNSAAEEGVASAASGPQAAVETK
ncbi:MAG: TolC family protein [Victivallales bacterium]|nr:TolC family protein [Victivallales bacterium]